MGLDITAYSKLVKISDIHDQESEVSGLVRIYVNEDFPKQAGALTSGDYRLDGESQRFRAGSYSGYGYWRELLAKLAKYPKASVKKNEYSPAQELHAGSAWTGEVKNMPFIELINFSDCEGVIDAATSAKLAKDFQDWDSEAKKVQESYFYESYTDWHQAFELASDNGAVMFH